MFFFRINKVKIRKNREAVMFWELDQAEMELWSFITTDVMPLPDVSGLLQTTDPAAKKAIVESIAQEVVTARKVAYVDHIRDDQTLTFGDTGYVLYQSNTIPQNLNWNFLMIELDGDRRDAGKLLRNVISSPQFIDFADKLPNALIDTANPAYRAVVAVSRFVTNILVNQLENEDDDLVGMMLTSLNRREHYPHGERKRDNVADLTGNMWVDYSMFGFEA